jgi:5-methylcytosine-specific restriction endonuclease McrA
MSEQVLVLNQNFEPLNVCHTYRAVVLITTGKAEIVSNGRGYIHTATAQFPKPSVIRLAKQIHRPRPHLKLSRRGIFRRDNYRCQYCGVETSHLTLDHIVPRSRGGAHTWTNLVSACADCNRRKGGKSLAEARMKLLTKPVEPRVTTLQLFGIYLNQNQEWLAFIST